MALALVAVVRGCGLAVRPGFWVTACLGLAFLAGCAPSKVPGIDLGAPSIAWKDKNPEQRFGFMAAAVEPQMEAIFVKHDKAYGRGFDCATCHGEDGETVDWKMPNDDLYALPKEGTMEASMEFDEDVTKFMADDVTPALKRMLNEGHGGPTEVSCFSCHPAE
jgi:hypothetical protein